MNRICIVAVGYNRPKSMKRLLESLAMADYGEDKVDLVVSIDRGRLQDEIVILAENFNWKYGNKKVRAFSERQGLRAHILQCGDVVNDYDAIIVLEDDITVSKYYYNYAKQAIAFYANQPQIGGISLYKHCINVDVGAFFEPEFNGYDVFLMQYAQSWGQCWTKKMWSDFRKWYLHNEKNIFSNDKLMKKIPRNIKGWGNQSWLKYFMAYIVENNLYFVYPYHALSTNHTEAGQHNSLGSNDYQVPLANGKIEYRFPCLNKAVKYDVFFERQELCVKNYADKKVILDLYGAKDSYENADILISSRCCDYRVLESWKLKYHPHEINCLLPEQGPGLYVYDLKTKAAPPKNNVNVYRTRFDVRSITWKKMAKLCVCKIKEAILRRLNKCLKVSWLSE